LRLIAREERRGLLDYDDLIGQGGSADRRVDGRLGALQLDLGIDHVLIAEAQTSAKQWEIIGDWADSPPARAREATRSIFASATKAVDILVPGARARAISPKRRGQFRATTSGGLEFRAASSRRFIPLGATSRGRRTVFGSPEVFVSADRRAGIPPTLRYAISRRAGRALAMIEPDEKRRIGLGTPVRRTLGNQPARAPRARIAATVRIWIAQRWRAGKVGVRGVTFWCWVRQRVRWFERSSAN